MGFELVSAAVVAVGAVSGRFVTKVAAGGPSPTILTLVGASAGAALGFLIDLYFAPVLVIDPRMVMIQLPAIGALVGAVVESLALAWGFVKSSTYRKRALRNLLISLVAGGISFGWLAGYNHWFHTRRQLDPPTIGPVLLDRTEPPPPVATE